jgi:hypothetical protein
MFSGRKHKMSSPADAEDYLQHADELVIEDSHSRPPREVLAQMRRAASLDADMRARGQQVHFENPMDGPLEISILGPDAAPVRRISVTETVDLACGGQGA